MNIFNPDARAICIRENPDATVTRIKRVFRPDEYRLLIVGAAEAVDFQSVQECADFIESHMRGAQINWRIQ